MAGEAGEVNGRQDGGEGGSGGAEGRRRQVGQEDREDDIDDCDDDDGVTHTCWLSICDICFHSDFFLMMMFSVFMIFDQILSSSPLRVRVSIMLRFSVFYSVFLF